MSLALNILGDVAGAAGLMGLVFLLTALFAVWRFSRRRLPAAPRLPAVTVLKPLCGLDPELYENLVSFCRQDYPAPIQIVFGVHRESDPAVVVAQRLMREFREVDLELVVDGTLPGTNFKVCNLANMMAAAKHEFLVVSDSDMRVGSDYLAAIIPPLLEPGVGITTTLYKARPLGRALATRLAAGFINYGFLPSVLVGKILHAAPFCSGATLAIRRETLQRIGGFGSLTNQLADDYAMGASVRSLGLKVALSRYVVLNVVREANLRSLFRHELRWQRTVRTVTPLGLAASVIINPVALALVTLPLTGFTPAAWLLLAATLAARLALIYMCDRVFELVPMGMVLAPLREILSQLVLAVSFCGQQVTWRESRFQVGRRGELRLEGDKVA